MGDPSGGSPGPSASKIKMNLCYCRKINKNLPWPTTYLNGVRQYLHVPPYTHRCVVQYVVSCDRLSCAGQRGGLGQVQESRP